MKRKFLCSDVIRCKNLWNDIIIGIIVGFDRDNYFIKALQMNNSSKYVFRTTVRINEMVTRSITSIEDNYILDTNYKLYSCIDKMENTQNEI
jgi:hypothetical protein